MEKKRSRLDFVESCMHYKGILLLLVAAGVLFGIYSLVVMPKNEFPSFTVRQGLIVAVYPGATSNEVEQQVAMPLEEFLWEFKEIDKGNTYTQSKDGRLFAFVALNDDVTNKDEFWSKFKTRISLFKNQLPQGVLALVVNDDFGDVSSMLITLESEDKTYRQLHEYVKELETRLRTVPNVGDLKTSGEQQEQIGVYIDRDRLAAYGITLRSLVLNLRTQGLTVISGSLNNPETKSPIHLSSSLNTENDVAQQVIFSNPLTGAEVRLRDVATIKREYPHPTSFVTNSKRKCIVLSVGMQEGSNIVQFGDNIKKEIADFQKTLPNDISIYTITDQSEVVSASVYDFLKELLIAIVTVILVIMVLLPVRVASVAAATIPVTIFISLGIFNALGIELNTVTLAALIVTLGLIVDDSVVIIDCYLEKVDDGMSRWHAASAAAKEFFKSILTATLVISLTFFPLLLTMRGVFYDFIHFFPYAISIILLTSLLMAVVLVPLMQFTFIKKGLAETGNKGKKTLLDRVQEYYNRLIEKCFEFPILTIFIGFISMVVGALLYLSLPQRFLPRAERNQFAVEIYMPTGTAIDKTVQIADSLYDIMRQDERIVNIATFYGSGSPRFQTSYAPQIGGSNFAQFIVNTKGDEATQELLDELTPKYSEYFPEAHVRFKELDYSDAISPIEFRLMGDNLADLHKAVDKVAEEMRKNEKLSLVRTSFEGTTPGMFVQIDNQQASRIGISKTDVAINLATQFGDGLAITKVWEEDYAMDVTVKDRNAGNNRVSDLKNANISGNLPGISVPLRQIAKPSADFTEGQITRRNGIRCISIYAEVKRGENLTNTVNELDEELKKLDLPDGVTLVAGGQKEKDAHTIPQIINGLLISIFVIFVILIFHLRNIRQSLLLMLSLPACLLGAALGVILLGQEVGITAILGLITLMGIIVRNGIIMIDYAEELRVQHRLAARQAAIMAAQRRMRPIFMTCAAASMGVVPMVISNTPLWGPMGTVVMVGTIVSFFFIVTVIPVGYWGLFQVEDRKRILKNERRRILLLRRRMMKKRLL
ncbi:MAG: efflux RND transporter permease subunit [Paludibacteraceae bacterium]|nr:efflux RND transporter permease subunit [Paludibacteraceae bacterium]